MPCGQSTFAVLGVSFDVVGKWSKSNRQTRSARIRTLCRYANHDTFLNPLIEFNLSRVGYLDGQGKSLF